MKENTLTIIKPYAVSQGYTGKIIDEIIKNNYDILAIKKVLLSKERAEKFYQVHKERSFYEKLVEFMISGPCFVLALNKENAIEDFRKLIGNTDSSKAKKNTIRGKYGLNNRKNAVHGSDSVENSEKEIAFFFSNDDIIKV